MITYNRLQLVKDFILAIIIYGSYLSLSLFFGCCTDNKIIVKEIKIPYEVRINDSIPVVIHDTVVTAKRITGKDTTLIKYYPKYHYITLTAIKHDTVLYKDSINTTKTIINSNNNSFLYLFCCGFLACIGCFLLLKGAGFDNLSWIFKFLK